MSMSARFAWLAAVSATLAVGCGIIAAPDRDKIPSVPDGGAGGVGGEGGTLGGGGTGGAECTAAGDCTLATECQTAGCESGSCVYTNNDGDVCSTGFCDGGDCVECLTSDQCPGDANVCNPDTNLCEDLCANGAVDGNETDVDCGGADCAPCANGLACVVFGDCAGAFCDDTGPSPLCAACTDNMECQFSDFCDNSACVPKLFLGEACTNGVMCAGGDCVDDVCCDNNCQNPCQSCVIAGQVGQCGFHAAGSDPDMECGTDVCGGGPACRCANGAMDGAETDTDCGGGVCSTCADGLACGQPSDCTSNNCVMNVCQP
jgi:hypothetical protein